MQGISRTGRDLWDAGGVTGPLVPPGGVFAFSGRTLPRSRYLASRSRYLAGHSAVAASCGSAGRCWRGPGVFSRGNFRS